MIKFISTMILLGMLAASCKKRSSPSEEINPSDTIAMSNWRFTEGSREYRGTITACYFNSSPPNHVLTMEGTLNSGTDTTILILICFPASSISKGTFSSVNGTQLLLESTAYPMIYWNTPYSATSPVFSATITKYDVTTREIRATLSGKIYNKHFEVVTITNGAFRSFVTY